jgi:hypothetical protein
MAFEPDGFTTTSFVGTDYSNLTWQVNHAAGKQLMLSMADSLGNSGGVGSQLHNELYTVVAGQDSSCLPPKPTTSLAIKANVTKDLATCDYWGLRVTGGSPPYNISLAAVGSPVVTNVSLAEGIDVMTYIDRADPNGLLLAAVIDSTGQWGNTSSVVNTVGSANYSCPGLITGYGSSSQIPFYWKSRSKSNHTTIITAVCATVGSLLVVIGAIFFAIWMRRRIRAARWIEDGQDTFPRVFKNPDTIDSPDSFLTLERKKPLPASAGTSITPTAMSTPQASGAVFDPWSLVPPPGIPNHPRPLHQAHSFNLSSSSTSKDRGNAMIGSPDYLPLPKLPLSPITLEVTHSNDNDDMLQTRSSNQNLSAQPHIAEAQLVEHNTEPDVIIQHRSGGVVQELPPPYLDRLRKQLPPDPSTSGSETQGLAL